ncbi:hypothetical protein niasHT_020859 [Heterodera trifolii]|uniref:Uncharacterized protein n=1 Tax=Heterodera trifolii TaxID=157864 RepID=A0ABD2KLK5_9BILA
MDNNWGQMDNNRGQMDNKWTAIGGQMDSRGFPPLPAGTFSAMSDEVTLSLRRNFPRMGGRVTKVSLATEMRTKFNLWNIKFHKLKQNQMQNAHLNY